MKANSSRIKTICYTMAYVLIAILWGYLHIYRLICVYLGSISYWIYLLHIVVGFVLANYFPNRSYATMLLVYVICVCAISAFFDGCFKLFKKK